MTDKPMTVDDLIVSIKVRLGELDLDIRDAKNNFEKVSKLAPNCYQDSYEFGTLETLRKERATLEQIMRGEYGRE